MKPINSLILICLFCFSINSSTAQDVLNTNSFFMDREENLAWLASLQYQNKNLQWHLIRTRYLHQNPSIKAGDDENKYIPLLIIDGKPLEITDRLNEKTRKKLLSLLSHDRIGRIEILVKEPEGLLLHQEFAGLIIATLNNKKAGKKWQKMEIE